MKLGCPFPVRKKAIDDLIESKHFEYEMPLKFAGETKPRKIYKVSIDMAKYRLANGRTQSAQEEYLVNHSEYPTDYFEKDLESEQVQTSQHEILRGMLIYKGVNLIQFFKTEKQDECLIIDNDGFVINGNRRLCAMRELYNGDKIKYQHFSHIDVLILPPCEEKDKDELEADLQIKQDIRADYTWTAEACMYRRRRNSHNYTELELALRYDKKVSEIREKIDLLEYAEEYLASRGIPKKYSEVLLSEFAFKQIRDGRNKNSSKDLAEKDIFQEIAFLMIDNPKETGMGRVYGAIGDVSNLLDKIEQELIDELPLEKYEYNVPNNKQLDLFSVESSEPNLKQQIGKLAQAVKDSSNKGMILEIVKDVVDREKFIDSQKENKLFVLKQLRKAHAYMKNAINGYSNETPKSGLEDQLSSIESLVAELKRKLTL